MRILITGGCGELGMALADLLADRDVAFTLLDRRPSPDGRPVHLADILDASALERAVLGHDVVVHAAALHGPHRDTVSPQDFLHMNAVGTYNVLAAAMKAGVRRLIYLSSTSVYGVSKNAAHGTAVYCDEATPIGPRDINDLSKVIGEQLCDYVERMGGPQCIRLRCGRFSFDDDDVLNLAKLSGAIEVTDVAEAVYRAVICQQVTASLLCITSPTRFSREDLEQLARDPAPVLESRYPGAMSLLQANGVRPPETIGRVICTQAAKTVLGFEAVRSFQAFLDELSGNAVTAGVGGGGRP
jgi:UDP-glucose 4-epimerase